MIKKILCAILFLFFLFPAPLTTAQTLRNSLFGNSTSTIEYFIRGMAKIYGVNPDMAAFIAKHESNFNPEAKGDDGKSMGLWQIYLKAHPDISKIEAMDIVSSTIWAMPHLKTEPNIWSVWRFRKK